MMKKRICAWFVLLALLLTAVPMAASAANTADDVIAHAKSRLGWMAKDFGFDSDWCGWFVCQMGREAGANFPSKSAGGYVINAARWFPNNNAGTLYYFEDSTLNTAKTYKGSLTAAGLTRCVKVSRSSFTPQKGDLFILHKHDDNVGFDHIGFVERYSNGNLYTVEGNDGVASGDPYYAYSKVTTNSRTFSTNIQAIVRPDYTTPITFSGMNCPTTLAQGKSFDLKGTIKSDSKITQIIAVIKQGDTRVKQCTLNSVNATSFDISKSSEIKNALDFSALSPGTYTLKYAVTNSAGGYKEWGGKGEEKTFQVVAGPSFSGMSCPSTLTQGRSFALQGTIKSGSNITKIIAAIKQGDTQVKSCTVESVNATSFDISKSSDIKNALDFSSLKVGTYTLKYAVYDAAGGYKEWGGKGEEKTFKVVAGPTFSSDMNCPYTLTRGRGFDLQGTIQSPSSITQIIAVIKQGDTRVKECTLSSVNATSFDISKSSAIKKALDFSALTPATYTLKYAVTNSAGGYAEWEKTFHVVTGPTFSGMNAPTALIQGKSFALQGTIQSPSNITQIIAAIKKGDTHVKDCTLTSVNAASFDVSKSSEIKKALDFSALKVGTYTLKYAVYNSAGGFDTWEKTFTVVPDPAAIEFSGMKYPVSLTQGQAYSLQGTITAGSNISKVIAAIKKGDVHVKDCTVEGINATTFKITGNSAIADALDFTTLAPGTYTVKYAVYYNASNSFAEWEKTFKVVKAPDPAPQEAPSMPCKIEAVTVDSETIFANLTASAPLSDTVTILVASYKDGKMLDIATARLVLTGGTLTTSQALDLATAEADSVSVYIIDSGAGLLPLAEKVERNL